MRFIKRKLAIVLAVLLMIPVQPVLADNKLQQDIAVESTEEETVTKAEQTPEETETAVTKKEIVE